MAVTRPQLRAYAHDGGKVVVGGGRDLQAGCPDVLHGGVKFIQLCCDGLLVHCTTWRHQGLAMEEQKTRGLGYIYYFAYDSLRGDGKVDCKI